MTQFMSNSIFFGAAISLIAYEAGLFLKRKFKMAIFNPLLIAIIAVMAVLSLLHIDYDTYNQSGQYISYLLTPATVCLAVPLYQQIELLKKNLKAVVIGIVSGVLASMVSVLMFAKLFRLSHEQYVTLLPKSITTAIGMGVSEELGGIVTITVAVIIITGVLGNMIAETVIKLAHIEEPIAKGLALGTSAHAIGTAKAMELGEVEGAMSSLAIAVAGLLTVVSASEFAQFMSGKTEQEIKKVCCTAGFFYFHKKILKNKTNVRKTLPFSNKVWYYKSKANTCSENMFGIYV